MKTNLNQEETISNSGNNWSKCPTYKCKQLNERKESINHMKIPRENRMTIRNTKAFKYTNAPWNDLGLNQGSSVGLMFKIMENHKFDTFEEWEDHYFKTGEIRREIIQKNPGMVRDVNLNKSHGRTKEELKFIALKLYKHLEKTGNPYKLTLDDCYLHVYVRVLDETYLGTERENRTIEYLKNTLNGYDILKTDPETDSKYAVDCEVYKGNELVCGIQVKSVRYKKDNSDILKRTKRFNTDKNNRYTEKNDSPVFYCYYDNQSPLSNTDVLTNIRQLS